MTSNSRKPRITCLSDDPRYDAVIAACEADPIYRTLMSLDLAIVGVEEMIKSIDARTNVDNNRRASWANTAVQAHGLETMARPEDEDISTLICDLLCNLRHLCVARGLDYAAIDKRSYRAYLEEIGVQPVAAADYPSGENVAPSGRDRAAIEAARERFASEDLHIVDGAAISWVDQETPWVQAWCEVPDFARQYCPACGRDYSQSPLAPGELCLCENDFSRFWRDAENLT